MFIYRPEYTKWYTLQTCLSNTQSSYNSSTKKPTRVIKNKDGDTISEDTEIAKRWTEYCNELYNYTINLDPYTLMDMRSKGKY